MNSRPSIDHTLLSPSGRCSKAARAAAIQREGNRLFPPGYWDNILQPTAEQQLAEKVATLRQSAGRLRDLAERGMSRRKYLKEAARLEAEADALLRKGD